LSIAVREAICIGSKEKRKKPASPHRKITTKTVYEIFSELAPTYVCHAYQIDEDSFYHLHRLLRKYMVKKKSFNNKKKKDSGKNGIITTIVRLSIAIRYFSGGDPYDISVVHSVSYQSLSQHLESG
jgi:hypothetical protein